MVFVSVVEREGGDQLEEYDRKNQDQCGEGHGTGVAEGGSAFRLDFALAPGLALAEVGGEQDAGAKAGEGIGPEKPLIIQRGDEAGCGRAQGKAEVDGHSVQGEGLGDIFGLGVLKDSGGIGGTHHVRDGREKEDARAEQPKIRNKGEP